MPLFSLPLFMPCWTRRDGGNITGRFASHWTPLAVNSHEVFATASTGTGCNTWSTLQQQQNFSCSFLMFWWQQKRLCPSCPSPRKSLLQQERWYLICPGSCRKEAAPSRQARKPRIGEQAGWESTGPGQTVRHGWPLRTTCTGNHQATVHLPP